MSRLQLEGTFVEVPNHEEVIRKLQSELAVAKEQARIYLSNAKEAAAALIAVRTQLEPLHLALNKLFGRFEEAEPFVPTAPTYATTVTESIWEARIAKASPAHGKVLRALLDGGGNMGLNQIRNVARTSSNTSKYLSELKSKNWVEQVGRGLYSLKQPQ